MDNTAPTFRTFIASFTDFLTVAIHTILYERQIYPTNSFLSSRRYNFPVRQNRHPKVCEWINDAVAAVEAELFKGCVDRVAVVIYTKHNKPIERFIFDVSRFPTVPLAEIDIPLERLGADGTKESILPTVDMEEQFRATMNRLSTCSAALKEPPAGCTFTVAIELKGEGQGPIGHPQSWVPAASQTKGTEKAKGSHNQTTPVRSVTAGEMHFETWIEEVNQPGDSEDPA